MKIHVSYVQMGIVCRSKRRIDAASESTSTVVKCESNEWKSKTQKTDHDKIRKSQDRAIDYSEVACDVDLDWKHPTHLQM